MKKPSAYLPLYGNDFFEAIAGYPDAVGMGYLRALWHYWNHTGCDGLPDDDEYLRRVRLDKIGFIFQFHNLLPFLDAKDNVALVLQLAGKSASEARSRAIELLDYLEVGHRQC